MGIDAWALVVAIASVAWSIVVWISSRHEARSARADADRAVEAAEESAGASRRAADAAERHAAAAERQLEMQLQDRAQAPPPWRIEPTRGNAGYELRNDGNSRAFAVTIMPGDRDRIILRVPAHWPVIDAHSAVAFTAVVPAGGDPELIVNWNWTPDGPLEEWITELPRR